MPVEEAFDSGEGAEFLNYASSDEDMGITGRNTKKYDELPFRRSMTDPTLRACISVPGERMTLGARRRESRRVSCGM
mgnify:CR=1 FL=1